MGHWRQHARAIERRTWGAPKRRRRVDPSITFNFIAISTDREDLRAPGCTLSTHIPPTIEREDKKADLCATGGP